ncbi:hypothetical protein GCM10009663_08470 [Kitasatospora arboriphila]|uniref:Uncharacterized protein n=1 Tax=Kitasatospora arboriphila TaxID=258052 RepID=A0ABN1TAT3_9ACTN
MRSNRRRRRTVWASQPMPALMADATSPSTTLRTLSVMSPAPSGRRLRQPIGGRYGAGLARRDSSSPPVLSDSAGHCAERTVPLRVAAGGDWYGPLTLPAAPPNVTPRRAAAGRPRPGETM